MVRRASHYDHGFAWVVAFCCFLANVAVAINILSFGVFLTELAEHFQMSMTILSLLGAIRSGLMYFTGRTRVSLCRHVHYDKIADSGIS